VIPSDPGQVVVLVVGQEVPHVGGECLPAFRREARADLSGVIRHPCGGLDLVVTQVADVALAGRTASDLAFGRE
jgi:hypothetical protein